MNPVLLARRRMFEELFTRVAGPHGMDARERIHRTPGPRWFEPGTPIRRVHADTSMYVGGMRALLLQSLHPLPMAAVADFSGYRSDPWGRLASTSTFLASTTFGTVEEAERAIAVVRAVHRRIKGTAPDGRPYDADDPELLSFVHAAEVDSFLCAYQRYGTRPLSAAECDEYVAQSAGVAERLGATDVPRSVAQLDAMIERFRPQLEGTRAARDVARFLLDEPPVSRFAAPFYGVLSGAAVELLQPWARDMLELRVPRLPTPVVRAGGRIALGGIGWVMGADPVTNVDEISPAA